MLDTLTIGKHRLCRRPRYAAMITRRRNASPQSYVARLPCSPMPDVIAADPAPDEAARWSIRRGSAASPLK
jgi:hypothetical protein